MKVLLNDSNHQVAECCLYCVNHNTILIHYRYTMIYAHRIMFFKYSFSGVISVFLHISNQISFWSSEININHIIQKYNILCRNAFIKIIKSTIYYLYLYNGIIIYYTDPRIQLFFCKKLDYKIPTVASQWVY